MEDDRSLGELYRNVEKLEQSMIRSFSDVTRRLESLQFVPRDVYQSEQRALDARVHTIEERTRWGGRQALTAVITVVCSVASSILLAVAVAP